MSKQLWGVWAPVLTTTVALLLVFWISPKPPIAWGIGTGLMIALGQSLISTGSLKWAWNKKYFYWVWGGGFFFRLIVFAVTAVVVYRFSSLSLVATLITMVSATTVFMVVESWAYLRDK
ncbi:hypothetical protein BVX98_03055 [bacterium F11]|nr:hypothetical protein BVX98_03055 [bacterium F11]